jgi:hypothetical protein
MEGITVAIATAWLDQTVLSISTVARTNNIRVKVEAHVLILA